MSGLGYILLDWHSNAQENKSNASAKHFGRLLLVNHETRVIFDGIGINILNNILFFFHYKIQDNKRKVKG